MRRINSLLLLLLFSYFANAQFTFQKAIGSPYHDYAFSIKQTLGGDYIIGVNSPDSINGYNKISFIKTNPYGDTICTKSYGELGHNLLGFDLNRNSDGSIVICGSISYINYEDILLLKTDSIGNILWQKSFSAPAYDRSYSIVQAPDDGFFITGYTSSFSVTSGVDAILMKTDFNGNLLWTKLFSNLITMHGYSINITNDGGAIVTGFFDNIGNGTGSLFLIRTDSLGNSLWSRTYSAGYGDKGSSVMQTSDGGFIVTGVTYVSIGPSSAINHILLLKTDSLGNVLWAKKFGGNQNDGGSSVKETDDNGFIITGGSNSFVGNGLYTSNAFLIKTNSNGIVNWCKYYGYNLNSNDVGFEIELTDDGGYIVLGSTTNNLYDAYLFKTDSLGNLSCNGYNYLLHDSIYISLSNTPSIIATSPVVSLGSTSIIVDHINYTFTDPCSVGIDEIDTHSRYIVFPNPGSGVFEFSNLEVESEIEIYNSLGILVIKSNSQDGSISINLTEKSKGIYYYKIICKYRDVNQGVLILQ